MANKVPWYTTFEWKNIAGGLLLALAIVAVLYVRVIPDLLKEDKLKQYTGQTAGTVTTIEENTGMTQDDYGTEIYIDSYTVTYSYQVNGVEYIGSEIVKLSPKTSSFIQRITNSIGESLVIRHDEAEPAKSTILID